MTIHAIHYETDRPVRIEITGSFITDIWEQPPDRENRGGLYVAPGLIDNQINGYGGVDFSGDDLTSERVKQAAEAIISDGVTTFMPTLITNSHENLIRNFKILAESLRDLFLKDTIPGFHLEGPYISTEEGFYGCHPVEYIRKPSWDEFAQYQEAAEGNIIQVTISPETEGALEFIRRCNENNINVALGHTNASAHVIDLAVGSGARLSTHLGNGCANMIHRHNNPLWSQLANDRLTPTLIADGHHLLPEEIRVFYKVKGSDNIILTSDVTHLTGMNPGNYVYFGSEVVLTADGLIKNPVLNCLAGASLPLSKGVGTMMSYTGCTPGEAIRMASSNAARIYGLDDRGVLAPGKRADIILFELKDKSIIIKETLKSGIRQ